MIYIVAINKAKQGFSWTESADFRMFVDNLQLGSRTIYLIKLSYILRMFCFTLYVDWEGIVT